MKPRLLGRGQFGVWRGALVAVAGARGAVLLLEWGSFRALLPIGIDFETFETLQGDRSLGPVSALLLAQCGYAPVNPKEWIEKLNPQVVLLSADVADPRGDLHPRRWRRWKGTRCCVRTGMDGSS